MSATLAMTELERETGTVEPRYGWRERARDYATLVRPRIAVMVLITVAIGAYLAAGSAASVTVVIHAMLGTLLTAGASSALNQLLERDTDALMLRTRDRPIPAGRLTTGEVMVFGLFVSAVGLAELAAFTTPLAAAIGFATLVLYVMVYTPLKRVTTLNTLAGAIPGAAPPVIGWCAAGGQLDRGALALFAIVFVWQFPHFLAIAWLHRDDYARAGLQMLPSVEKGSALRTRAAVPSYSLALVPVSLLPTLAGVAGKTYFFGALLLGVAFLAVGVGFALRESRAGARRLLLASLAYLPLIFLLMMLDRAA